MASSMASSGIRVADVAGRADAGVAQAGQAAGETVLGGALRAPSESDM